MEQVVEPTSFPERKAVFLIPVPARCQESTGVVERSMQAGVPQEPGRSRCLQRGKKDGAGAVQQMVQARKINGNSRERNAVNAWYRRAKETK